MTHGQSPLCLAVLLVTGKQMQSNASGIAGGLR